MFKQVRLGLVFWSGVGLGCLVLVRPLRAEEAVNASFKVPTSLDATYNAPTQIVNNWAPPTNPSIPTCPDNNP